MHKETSIKDPRRLKYLNWDFKTIKNTGIRLDDYNLQQISPKFSVIAV